MNFYFPIISILFYFFRQSIATQTHNCISSIFGGYFGTNCVYEIIPNILSTDECQKICKDHQKCLTFTFDSIDNVSRYKLNYSTQNFD